MKENGTAFFFLWSVKLIKYKKITQLFNPHPPNKKIQKGKINKRKRELLPFAFVDKKCNGLGHSYLRILKKDSSYSCLRILEKETIRKK